MSLDEEGASRRRIHLREISGESDSPLETVGQDLRAARTRRGDDLASVSKALKIRKDHLEALEENRLDDLPGKTYAIGFVRSYARHLGLDAVEMAERYKREISGRAEEHAPVSSNLHQDERKLPYGWRIVGGVVAIIFLYGVWHIFFAARDLGQQVPEPPQLAQAQNPVAVTSPAIDSADLPTASDDPANPVATPPSAIGPNSVPPPVLVVPPSGPDTSAASNASAPPSTDRIPAVPAVPDAAALGQENVNPRVVLRARGTTVVTVKNAAGQVVLNRALAAGDTYQVPNRPGYSMALSNAGALEVNLDGMMLGRAGQLNQVLGRVSLDPQDLMDRFNR